MLHVGPSTRFGVLEQDRSLFEREEPLLTPFVERTGLRQDKARALLARFALYADEVTRPARSLSPGERTRATLALLSAEGVNALVLDEPTNHLDLEAIEELERALEGYEGTIVLVTHDRRFLEAFAATATLELLA
jgi:ATPase subunit of ABC transporter with duplicated ATPase domains